MTLLLCGMSQQSFSLLVTHFAPESIAAQNTCLPENQTHPISDEQVDQCIHSIKHYVASMENHIKELFKNYTWLMNHANNLSEEQVSSIYDCHKRVISHPAYKIIEEIKKGFEIESEIALHQRIKNLITEYQDEIRSKAKILADGEAALHELEKTIKQHIALAHQNEH